LPQTRVEAQHVHRIFGGEIWYEKDARRSVLQAEPTQILHIAAHGEHRPDNPDLSFIQLSDGQLYTDDLLQHDLSYELVVLSACETGRVNVAPGDELIGLGRGFLYAGTGALIVSMWRVADDIVVELMAALYDALRQGLSKAAALRRAQLTVRDAHPHIHPAFWGAFQLIGDASPISVQQELAIGKDFLHEKHEIAAR
jgi:CHAT domain-containing protein